MFINLGIGLEQANIIQLHYKNKQFEVHNYSLSILLDTKEAECLCTIRS